MQQIQELAARAAEELRGNCARTNLRHTRTFADALNAELSKPGRFDPNPWDRVAGAFQEKIRGRRNLHLFLFYLAGCVSLLAAVLEEQHQVPRFKLVRDTLRLCDAIASPAP
ncbi:hypothetical protein COU18_03730 [Candidatus Kaiserbacteria bacterium CG10_big_fil_rev_8_21_14_0_10_51_14]|uniref:Uncharacterized protein n=1 Tax=Candidatus Kaiserbacteria bacterium CG10_big_fil_rev_8_21_14_0_10_51_14 TaxID=1974610 RepID=A0A2H0UD97_9BACT|nr:MAG: hypothetical protein COU18_03730 [Candidatus Kaiserbacteria bacterium CG10_big_fil_rev_8_21_14_0_10_51_14]